MPEVIDPSGYWKDSVGGVDEWGDFIVGEGTLVASVGSGIITRYTENPNLSLLDRALANLYTFDYENLFGLLQKLKILDRNRHKDDEYVDEFYNDIEYAKNEVRMSNILITGMYANTYYVVIKGTGKAAANMSEFFQGGFGKSIKNKLSKTKIQYDGQSIYKVINKTGNEYLKKGYGVYLDALHKDHLEVIDKVGKVKYVQNLDGTLNADKTKQFVELLKGGDKRMKDIVINFSKIINYIEGINAYNKLDDGLVDAIKEQRENIDDLKHILSQFEEYIVELDNYELIESDKTLCKLMRIHKFTADLEWHISEISELNEEVIKICSARRE